VPAVDGAGGVKPLGPDQWIDGFVYDAQTNSPIEGALVRANQGSSWWTDTTSSAGYYELHLGSAWGEFFMDASKAGYQTSQAYVYKEQDVELEKNWYLTPLANNPPYTPSNPSPANGATGQPTSLTLTWSGGDPDSWDTVTYHVYFGTSSPPPYDTDVSTASMQKSGLSYGTTYYWKIVSDDGEAQTAGPVWSFMTNRPPNTPSNPSPANGATGQSTSPTLSWSGGDPDGDSVTYDVYFGTSSNPPYEQTVSSTSIPKTGLNNLTTYYWRIVSNDGHGAQTTGPLWSFTTAGEQTNNPPNTPYNPSPTNAATGQPTSLTLTWTCTDPDPGDSIAKYYVYFGTSSNPPYNTTTTENSLPRGGLAAATTYYWKIVAEDSHGAQTTGPVWSFMTNRPPNTPSNPSPASGATGQPTSLTLSWSGGDPDGGTVTYMVYFGTSPNPSSYMNTTSTSLPKTGLAYGTTYYWKVKAVDMLQATATGPEWCFTTQTGFYYFLDEPFNSLSAWTDNTGSTFDVNIDGGAAHIYELGNGWENGGHYISRVVDIAGWLGTMYLELDWRAKSNYAYSSVTNAYVNFYSGSQSLGSVTLVAGGTYDTGWQHRLTDVSSILSGRSSVQVRLNVHDAWSANWQQQAWFDNVKLYSTSTNNPPYTPSNPSPANGWTGQPATLTLGWSGGDPDGDAVSYDVYVYRQQGSPPATPNRTVATNSTLLVAEYGTRYYWTVVAKDSHGAQTPGPEWSFRTEPIMYYGYYQVFDMGMSSYYNITPALEIGDHIAKATSQSNVIVMSDRVYVSYPFLNFAYDDMAVSTGVEIIFDVHSTFKFYWFDPTWENKTEPLKMARAQSDCEDYRDNGLEQNNVHVRAIYFFDEPVRGPCGPKMNATKLANMQQVVKNVWGDPSSASGGKPSMLVFHRLGNAALEWTSATFDEIAQTYVGYCDWVGVDPYTHPRYNAPPDYPLSIIDQDANWAADWGKAWAIIGQSWDPPNPPYGDGWAPFFETNNSVTGAHIIPDNETIARYYSMATANWAKALLWFWYPDSYASSFDERPAVQPVNNVWAKEREIWLAADLGWK